MSDQNQKEKEKEKQPKNFKEQLDVGLFEEHEIAQVKKDGPEKLIEELEKQKNLEKDPDEIHNIELKIEDLKRMQEMAQEDEEEEKEEKEKERPKTNLESQDVISQVVKMQKPLIDEIKNGVAEGSVKIFDKEGNKLNPEDYFTPGKVGKSGSLIIQGLKANWIAKLEEIYGKFDQLGFEVKMKSAKLSDGKTQHFFAVNFPSIYKGNTNPLTMTEEQISEAHNCQIHSNPDNRTTNIYSEAIGPVGSRVVDFHDQERQGFIKDIIQRGPRGHKYELENSDNWRKMVLENRAVAKDNDQGRTYGG